MQEKYNRISKQCQHFLPHTNYEPISIEELSDSILQGYSAVLNLHIRWGRGVALARAGTS